MERKKNPVRKINVKKKIIKKKKNYNFVNVDLGVYKLLGYIHDKKFYRGI